MTIILNLQEEFQDLENFKDASHPYLPTKCSKYKIKKKDHFLVLIFQQKTENVTWRKKPCTKSKSTKMLTTNLELKIHNRDVITWKTPTNTHNIGEKNHLIGTLN